MLEHIVPIIFAILISGIVFYLLRKKISNIENKVNLMFQLIQEHEKKEQLRNTVQQNNVLKSENIAEEDYDDSDDELINVSENEDNSQLNKKIINNNTNYFNSNKEDNLSENDSDDSDSDESTDDNSDNDKINIQELIDLDSKNKIINLEVENNNNIEDTISLKEITKMDNLENLDNENLDNIELSDNEINKTSEMSIDNDNNNSDNEVENNEDNSSNSDNNDKETNIKNEGINFTNFTVSELKKECIKRNLEGYKSLKKGALINLLQNS